MTAKERLHSLVDELSETEATAALDYLIARRSGGDGLSRLLATAPIDDEPTTPEEQAAVQQAREDLARGETVSLDEIRVKLS